MPLLIFMCLFIYLVFDFLILDLDFLLSNIPEMIKCCPGESTTNRLKKSKS